MNEVMCLAEDNNIDIYYQDTDSMHIGTDDIPKLADLFQQKYNRQLIGKNQGQFHSDFDSKLGKVLHADRSVFLGKKFYIDRLVVERSKVNQIAVKSESKEIVYDYHIRAKGLSNDCIIYRAKELGITVLELYERLFKGERIEFNLCCDGGVKF